MNYLANALSLGMLDCLVDGPVQLECTQISWHAAEAWAGLHIWESIVGHADTALLFTSLLGHDVQANRVSTSLTPGDNVLVGQYNGPRLPEGAQSLPDGAKIRWILVEVTS